MIDPAIIRLSQTVAELAARLHEAEQVIEALQAEKEKKP